MCKAHNLCSFLASLSHYVKLRGRISDKCHLKNCSTRINGSASLLTSKTLIHRLFLGYGVIFPFTLCISIFALFLCDMEQSLLAEKWQLVSSISAGKIDKSICSECCVTLDSGVSRYSLCNCTVSVFNGTTRPLIGLSLAMLKYHWMDQLESLCNHEHNYTCETGVMYRMSNSLW